MRKRVHSRAGLFLIELMISVLFFAITTSIFLQVFVKSENLRKESKELFEAQMNVASVAERIRGNVLEVPDGQTGETIFYDRKWERCEEKEKVYEIKLISHTEEEIKNVRITASSKEKLIYELNLQLY